MVKLKIIKTIEDIVWFRKTKTRLISTYKNIDFALSYTNMKRNTDVMSPNFGVKDLSVKSFKGIRKSSKYMMGSSDTTNEEGKFFIFKEMLKLERFSKQPVIEKYMWEEKLYYLNKKVNEVEGEIDTKILQVMDELLKKGKWAKGIAWGYVEQEVNFKKFKDKYETSQKPLIKYLMLCSKSFNKEEYNKLTDKCNIRDFVTMKEKIKENIELAIEWDCKSSTEFVERKKIL